MDVLRRQNLFFVETLRLINAFGSFLGKASGCLFLNILSDSAELVRPGWNRLPRRHSPSLENLPLHTVAMVPSPAVQTGVLDLAPADFLLVPECDAGADSLILDVDGTLDSLEGHLGRGHESRRYVLWRQ
jgi:hypothetical protein